MKLQQYSSQRMRRKTMMNRYFKSEMYGREVYWAAGVCWKYNITVYLITETLSLRVMYRVSTSPNNNKTPELTIFRIETP